MFICLSALCTFWIHVAIWRTWSILKNKNIQISSFMQTPKIMRFVKKWQEPSGPGTDLPAARWGWRQETTEIKFQGAYCNFLFLSQALSLLPCIPPSGREWPQRQFLPKENRVCRCHKQWAAKQRAGCPCWCCSPALTQPRGSRPAPSATRQMPLSFCPIPVLHFP